MLKLTRRETMAFIAGGLSLAAMGRKAAADDGNNHAELIAKFTGGKTPATGKISLDLPEIAENGNTVPMSISVDSPMSRDNYVKRVLVVADGNPRGGLASFNFSPKSGVAEASTRIRLAKTQNVIAVAEMSDGTFFTAKREVKVTIGGCGG